MSPSALATGSLVYEEEILALWEEWPAVWDISFVGAPVLQEGTFGVVSGWIASADGESGRKKAGAAETEPENKKTGENSPENAHMPLTNRKTA